MRGAPPHRVGGAGPARWSPPRDAAGSSRPRDTAGSAVAITAVASLLLAPAAYATTAVQRVAGSEPWAGPPAADIRPVPSGGHPATAIFDPSGVIAPDVLSFLTRQRGAARYLVAVTSTSAAEGTIIATGLPVLPMGGYGGGDPAPTVAGLADLVRSGDLRFVIIVGGSSGSGLAARRNAWVEHTCRIVDPAAFSAAGTDNPPRITIRSPLYDCAARS